jgi:hypothetical protein
VTRIDQPETGPYPAGPGRTTIAGAGFIGGLMLGLGLVFLNAGPQPRVMPPQFSAGEAATASTKAPEPTAKRVVEERLSVARFSSPPVGIQGEVEEPAPGVVIHARKTAGAARDAKSIAAPTTQAPSEPEESGNELNAAPRIQPNAVPAEAPASEAGAVSPPPPATNLRQSSPWVQLPEVADTSLEEQLVMTQLAEAANSSWLTESTANFTPRSSAMPQAKVDREWPNSTGEEEAEPVAATASEAPVATQLALPKTPGQLPKAVGKLPGPASLPGAGMSLQEALKAARLAQR